MAENTFQTTVDSLMKGMDGFVSSKTVVGEAIHIGAVSYTHLSCKRKNRHICQFLRRSRKKLWR